MSDNTTLPGTGDVIAADDVAGVKYQIIKLAIGGDGSASLVSPTQPIPVGGLRRDADTPVYADGQLHPFLFGPTGRLKVSALPADITPVTGDFTAAGQTLAIDCARASNIVITMVATAAPTTGHAATFEHSNNSTDGVDGNWYVCQVVRSNANTVETATGTLTATPTYSWEASVNAYKWFRVRTTAQTAGVAAYTLAPGAYATEPIPASQVTGIQPVSGTVTATVTGGTTLPVTPTTTFTNSAATTNATLIKSTAGSLWSISASNTNAAARFLKLYNKAVAPTVGTDTPVLTMPLPPGTVTVVHGGSNGIRFSAGIALAITASAADSDTTAVALGEVKLATSFT